MDKHSQWKNKVQGIFQVCQDEIKRTTEIGKKMLSASKANSLLHESYEELGQLVAKSLKEGELKWDNPKAHELLSKINSCHSDLEEIEGEVNKIKFSSGPVDISRGSDLKESPQDPTVAEKKSGDLKEQEQPKK